MQQPQQIDMGLQAPRQNYGLGSFVKKAVRGVKKIAKSPLGKAAMLAAGGYYLGGGSLLGMQRAGMQGFSMGNLPGIGGLFAKGTGPNVNSSFLSRMGGKALGFAKKNPGKAAMLGLGAASIALPFMGGGGDDEESSGSDPMDPAAVTQRARNY